MKIHHFLHSSLCPHGSHEVRPPSDFRQSYLPHLLEGEVYPSRVGRPSNPCSKMAIFLLALCVCFFCSFSNTRADSSLLTPDAVVQLALAHSPALKGRNEDLHMASARRLQADAGLKPQLDARAQAQHFEGLENGTLGPGVTLPVMTDQYSASIGLTQPLYTGGRVTHQRRSTRLDEAAARQSLDAAAADIELQTLTAYWQWSKALAQIAAFQSSVTRTETQLTDIKNLKNAGMATDNDLLATEVLLDQIQLQLQAAQQQADLNRIQLTQLTGQEISLQQSPRKPDAPTVTPFPNLEEALVIALSNRPELASLRLSAQAKGALIGAARAEARPQLALIARYEQGNPNPRDFPPEDKWRDDAFIGAAVTWNLFDGGLIHARTAEAKARATRDEYQTQALGEAILAETKAAFLSRNYALAQLKTSRHAEASSTRNLQVATDQWKSGTSRHSDVLDAQTKLTLSTAQRISAEADFLIAEATLKHAIYWKPSSQ
ncbi:MAG: TolC family protein [bacterium]